MAIARHWCFTLNNPDELLDLSDMPHHRYSVYQGEIGDENTYHFQGYIEFDSPVRLSALKKYEPLSRAHFEMRKGTREEARAYCMKPDSRQDGPYEAGLWKAGGNGARNDILAFKASIDEGKSDLQLWDLHPGQFLRYMNGVNRIRLLKTGLQRTWEMEVQYLYGPPGTGKSRAAMTENLGAFWLSKTKWWDGYQGEPTVILDEFDGTWFQWTFLMKLLDRYPLNVEIKGGTIPFTAKKIVMTSNRAPWELYSRWKFPLQALFRRITQIRFYFSSMQPHTTPSLAELILYQTGQELDYWLNQPKPTLTQDDNG